MFIFECRSIYNDLFAGISASIAAGFFCPFTLPQGDEIPEAGQVLAQRGLCSCSREGKLCPSPAASQRGGRAQRGVPFSELPLYNNYCDLLRHLFVLIDYGINNCGPSGLSIP